jgi:hypothetical protein
MKVALPIDKSKAQKLLSIPAYLEILDMWGDVGGGYMF